MEQFNVSLSAMKIENAGDAVKIPAAIMASEGATIIIEPGCPPEVVEQYLWFLYSSVLVGNKIASGQYS